MATSITGHDDYRRVDHVRTQDLSIFYRVVAAIAGAVPTVIGLIALVRIPWDNGGLEAPAVSVAGMTFTPTVAIGTTVLGLLALIAGTTRDRAGKLFVGGLLLCVGFVALIGQPNTRYVVLENAHGWLMVIVGAVLVVAAMLMSVGATRRHELTTDAVETHRVR